MANVGQQGITELSKPKANPSLLNYEDYYNALMLAKKIRLEKATELSSAKTPKEKTKLLEELFIQYNIPASSSSNPKDKELATLLKINIFIPDNEQFIADYKTKFGKNVRLIAEDYQIPAPFVFQKVAEIGKYEQYLSQIEKEGGLGEPTLEDNSTLGVIASLATSGALKSLYDSDTPKQKEKKKKGRKKKNALEEKKDSVSKQNEGTTLVQSTIPSSSSFDGIVSEELLHHIDSMQRYCTRLLDQNEQLGANNDTLTKFNKELEELLKRLKLENNSLKEQLDLASSEKKALESQIAALTKEKLALTTQISSQASDSTNTTRTIADETKVERELRQEIAVLRCTNQELTDQLAIEEDKKHHYRNRAVVAEAQLEQLQHGMQGIFKEVDELDLSFADSSPKKS